MASNSSRRESAELRWIARAGSQVRFDLVIPDDLWPAEIDAAQISQVFDNVLLNARQAVPEGSVIEVRGENVVIEENALSISAGKYVRIFIRDHGRGILYRPETGSA